MYTIDMRQSSSFGFCLRNIATLNPLICILEDLLVSFMFSSKTYLEFILYIIYGKVHVLVFFLMDSHSTQHCLLKIPVSPLS